MKNQKFSKVPLTNEEKEKLSAKFMEVGEPAQNAAIKQKVKPLYLRVPDSFLSDIREISAITGLTMNAVCLDILRPGIKNKLKEIKE